ncbi:hypothetical protein ASPZODRAFT_136843 [Penicilliopsis zonata CBS 506.65]|uniref:Secreted protein n=1 Tax=Penicilliopsis zonata CBS 506.65 TaxID=1073090 RepID=A0A1L9S729_9EURO|nr:hypothetical protein ASPZODRAFT_136843 [Penicilliopsis zonata CBS 506.65]OJJ42967.1 hypothetical protein ASPZODRAFT_136843 [Penicilliopsis zonata CBS 506.65]
MISFFSLFPFFPLFLPCTFHVPHSVHTRGTLREGIPALLIFYSCLTGTANGGPNLAVETRSKAGCQYVKLLGFAFAKAL